MRLPMAITVVVASMIQLSACIESPVRPGDDAVRVGTWAGEQVVLTVTSTGAHLELPCASGDIESLALNNTNSFSADGVFVKERPGPRRGEEHKARFFGTVASGSMTLNIRVSDSDETFGPFTLTFGAQPRLTKCV